MNSEAVRAAFSLVIASFLSLGMSNCSGVTFEQACNSQLPDLQKELNQVARDVAMATPEGYPSRTIASVGNEIPPHLNDVVVLSLNQKEQWENWSEVHLVEVEHYLDYVRARSELRAARSPLSDLADQLVRFSGYVGQGKAYQAISTLRLAQSDTDAVMQQYCSAGSIH